MNVDWKSQRFNGANADMLGKAAALAYMNDANITATAKSWNMNLVRFFSLKETQAYIVGDDKTWILAFRGTEPSNVLDWITDFDAKLINGPAGKSMRGFGRSLLRLERYLENSKRRPWISQSMGDRSQPGRRAGYFGSSQTATGEGTSGQWALYLRPAARRRRGFCQPLQYGFRPVHLPLREQ